MTINQKVKSYTLEILETTGDLEKEIATNYWALGNGKFLNKPTVIAERYNLSVAKLKFLIKDISSMTRIFDNCIDCNIERSDTVDSQTSFVSTYRIKDRCDDCTLKHDLELKEQSINRKRIRTEIKQNNFDEAINNQNWKKLTDSEYQILNLIITHQTKSKIYSFVFKDDPLNKDIWRLVNKLESLNLIFIERGLYDRIIDFHFDPRLKDRINNTNSSEVKNTFGFSLEKKVNRTKETQPHYGGTFVLKDDVILRAGEVYLYGGWIQNDQSINLKFTPIEKIKQAPTQTNLNHKPEHISDIINSMFNKL